MGESIDRSLHEGVAGLKDAIDKLSMSGSSMAWGEDEEGEEEIFSKDEDEELDERINVLSAVCGSD